MSISEVRRSLEEIRDRAQAGDLSGFVQSVSAALEDLDANRLLTTTEAAAYLNIRSVNTLKLLVRRLNMPYEMHGSRMMIPVSALEAVQGDATIAGVQASDRAHDALSALDDTDNLSDEFLDMLEHSRPGQVPWSAKNSSDDSPK
ncbi:MAG: helix-turn-helix domain-containing protein [Chloroflexota bacterium]